MTMWFVSEIQQSSIFQCSIPQNWAQYGIGVEKRFCKEIYACLEALSNNVHDWLKNVGESYFTLLLQVFFYSAGKWLNCQWQFQSHFVILPISKPIFLKLIWCNVGFILKTQYLKKLNMLHWLHEHKIQHKIMGS